MLKRNQFNVKDFNTRNILIEKFITRILYLKNIFWRFQNNDQI